MYTLPIRLGIRKKYGIQGNCCVDCLATAFCETCATCQEHRESKIRLAAKGGAPCSEITDAVIAQPITEDSEM